MLLTILSPFAPFFSFIFDPCCYQSSQFLFSPAFQFPFSNMNRFQTPPAHLPLPLPHHLGWHCPKIALVPSVLAATICLLHVVPFFISFLPFTCCPVPFSLSFWSADCTFNMIPNCCFWGIETFVTFQLALLCYSHFWIPVSHTLTWK